MRDIHTSDQVRATEALVAATLPEGELMQRAAHALSTRCLSALAEHGGGQYGRRVAMLVGSGGNGGDALWAGALLRHRGVSVTALLARPDSTYPGALGGFHAAGGLVLDLADLQSAEALAAADLIIDGLVGLGSARAIDLPCSIVEALAHSAAPIVAVDIPSGVNTDTGQVYEGAIKANLTVTFSTYKPGHFLAPAKPYCGKITEVDLGVGESFGKSDLRVLESADVNANWPRPDYAGHKYSTGVVGIAAGSARYPGAAILATGAALRAKSGMVRYLGEAAPADRVLDHFPEVVLAQSLQDDRTSAWVVGPGLGSGDRAESLVAEALQLDRPLLLDADALGIIGTDHERLRTRSAATILTPHTGEFTKMFGSIGSDPLAAVRTAAKATSCVILLKGPTTIVAEPGGKAFVNSTGTAQLATAGTGDVLSGIIGALLASGIDPLLAGGMGAHVHGLLAERATGPLVAMDLVDGLSVLYSELLSAPPVHAGP